MKISDINNQPSKAVDIGRKEVGNHIRVGQSSFARELDKATSSDVKEKLSLLLKKIDVQADKFSKNIDISELLVYKKLVSEFLRESVDSMVKFSKNSFLDRRGRHRIYAIVKKVNRELEELTEEVLSKEKNNINILKKLDDIRGLILDIYM